MKSKNELFLEAVDYLIDEGLATDQGDLAQKAGLGPNLISRVRNGRVKSVSDDSIRALASKFNLNLDYFRGKSEYITRYGQASANLDYELKEAQKLLDKDPFAPSPQPIDQSSLVNAALAAKDETIAALRSQLADLRMQLLDKQNVIDAKDQLIDSLKMQINNMMSEMQLRGISTYPFEIGVAEKYSAPNKI